MNRKEKLMKIQIHSERLLYDVESNMGSGPGIK